MSPEFFIALPSVFLKWPAIALGCTAYLIASCVAIEEVRHRLKDYVTWIVVVRFEETLR